MRLVVTLIVALVVALAVQVVLASPTPGGVQHLTPGVLFENATYTGPPSCENMLLTSMNPDTPLRVCAIVRRPPEGGGLYILTLFTADGILVDRDLREYGYEDCFGADPWVSNFTGTIKATVNCKPPDGGNDRVFFPVDTHIGAEP